jgi:phenylacetate-CoA ligase
MQNPTQYSIQDLCSRMAHGLYTSIWPGRYEINHARRSAISQQVIFNNLPSSGQEVHLLRSLQDLVKYCRREVPYYMELLKDLPPGFPSDFAEYRQLPILDKAIIRSSGDSLLSREFSKKDLIKCSTGGSTGEPVSVYITKADHGADEASDQLFMRKIGGKSGNRIGTLYGGSLDVSATPALERRIKNWFWNYCEHGCFRLDEQYLLKVHADFQHFLPDVLLGYASAIYLLALTLKSRGIQPDYPRYSVLTAAEKLEDKQREMIESVFKVPVVERYGSRDVGLMACQSPGDLRFWIDRWACLIEPDENPDEKGNASLLITRLHMKGMPLLRYRIGDQARFLSSWTPRSPARWLEEINGRILDFIYLPEGRKVHGSEFPHMFKDHDIILYQVRQEKDGSVMVSIVPGEGFDQKHRDECERIIRGNLSGISVQFCYEKEIIRSSQQKLRTVISNYSPTKLQS